MLLDVRESASNTAAAHAPSAKLISLGSASQKAQRASQWSERFLVICASGMRSSSQASSTPCKKRGINVTNISGGMAAWQRAGLRTVREVKVVIVGGVAGGMSTATRLRRLREDAEIIVFEQGPHVSYANCGLPYHIGEVIPAEKDLLLQTPGESLGDRFRLDVRVHLRVVGNIDRRLQDGERQKPRNRRGIPREL